MFASIQRCPLQVRFEKEDRLVKHTGTLMHSQVLRMYLADHDLGCIHISHLVIPSALLVKETDVEKKVPEGPRSTSECHWPGRAGVDYFLYDY